jgi:hypothetical protein
VPWHNESTSIKIRLELGRRAMAQLFTVPWHSESTSIKIRLELGRCAMAQITVNLLVLVEMIFLSAPPPPEDTTIRISQKSNQVGFIHSYTVQLF